VFWRFRIACVSLPAGTRSGLFFPSVSQFVLPLRARARHSIRLASALYFPDRFLVGAGQRARSRSCSDFRSVFLCRLGVDARVQIPFSFLPLYLKSRAATSSFVTVLAPDLAWILIPVQTSFHRCLLLPSAGSDLGFVLLARAGAS
jgi:hypothetical protein